MGEDVGIEDSDDSAIAGQATKKKSRDIGRVEAQQSVGGISQEGIREAVAESQEKIVRACTMDVERCSLATDSELDSIRSQLVQLMLKQQIYYTRSIKHCFKGLFNTGSY